MSFEAQVLVKRELKEIDKNKTKQIYMMTYGRRNKLYLKNKKGNGKTYASRTFQKTETLDQEL